MKRLVISTNLGIVFAGLSAFAVGEAGGARGDGAGAGIAPTGAAFSSSDPGLVCMVASSEGLWASSGSSILM